MINFICGRPGGGKSFYCVIQLCRELELTERHIVTNLPLNLGALAEWCQENIEKPVDLSKRLLVLPDDQVCRFWLYEPGEPALKARWCPLGDERQDCPDFRERQARSPGCFYIIDECHLHFGARQWQQVSGDAEYFMSQHRKLKCDVFLVTQHPEKVDKNFRRNAQDFTVLRNLGNERFAFGTALHGRIRRATYLGMPSGSEKPMETAVLSLDVKRYGGLYDTSAGVGMVGRVDTKEQKRGRSVWFLGFPLVGGVLAVVALLFLFNRGIGWATSAMLGGLEIGRAHV